VTVPNIIPADLGDLAGRINQEHRQCEDAVRAGLEHARNAGRLLAEAKGKVTHGQWLPWLEKHCDFSVRTAQGYMRVAERWPELESKAQRVSHLSYREALSILAEPREEAARKPEPNETEDDDLDDLGEDDDEETGPSVSAAPDPGFIVVGGVTFTMPFAHIFPDISGAAWSAFKKDVGRAGVLRPILVDEHMGVIDGRQRLRAAAELGLQAVPFQVCPNLSDHDKLRLNFTANMLRKHHTQAERDRIEANRKAGEARRTGT
jgi:hypothetical protein